MGNFTFQDLISDLKNGISTNETVNEDTLNSYLLFMDRNDLSYDVLRRNVVSSDYYAGIIYSVPEISLPSFILMNEANLIFDYPVTPDVKFEFTTPQIIELMINFVIPLDNLELDLNQIVSTVGIEINMTIPDLIEILNLGNYGYVIQDDNGSFHNFNFFNQDGSDLASTVLFYNNESLPLSGMIGNTRASNENLDHLSEVQSINSPLEDQLPIIESSDTPGSEQYIINVNNGGLTDTTTNNSQPNISQGTSIPQTPVTTSPNLGGGQPVDPIPNSDPVPNNSNDPGNASDPDGTNSGSNGNQGTGQQPGQPTLPDNSNGGQQPGQPTLPDNAGGGQSNRNADHGNSASGNGPPQDLPNHTDTLPNNQHPGSPPNTSNANNRSAVEDHIPNTGQGNSHSQNANASQALDILDSIPTGLVNLDNINNISQGNTDHSIANPLNLSAQDILGANPDNNTLQIEGDEQNIASRIPDLLATNDPSFTSETNFSSYVDTISDVTLHIESILNVVLPD